MSKQVVLSLWAFGSLAAIGQNGKQGPLLQPQINAVEQLVKLPRDEMIRPAVSTALDRPPDRHCRPAATGFHDVHAFTLPNGLLRRNHGLIPRQAVSALSRPSR